jgi:hypothetical protein
LKNDPFQLIPPKLARRARVAGCDEKSRRDVVLLEQRRSLMEIVGIAIVESDRDPDSALATEPPSGINLIKRDSLALT